MPERERGMRSALVALGIAVVVVLGAAAWAITGRQARAGATDDVDRAKTTLASTRQAAALVHSRLVRIDSSSDWLTTQADVVAQARTVGQLDQQELESMQRALDAGIAGDVTAYNRAVAARNALDAPHDAATGALVSSSDRLEAQFATW